MGTHKQSKANFCKTKNTIATAHARWLYAAVLFSLVGVSFWFPGEKHRNKQQQWAWKHQTAHSFCCGCREKSQAVWWFNCHCVTFSVTLLKGGGGFLSQTAAAVLCCRWGILAFSENSNPCLNKGQASSLLGPVSPLCLQLKYWDALC